jgi:hypothetical protein
MTKGRFHKKILRKRLKKIGKLPLHRLYDEIPKEILEDEKDKKMEML